MLAASSLPLSSMTLRARQYSSKASDRIANSSGLAVPMRRHVASSFGWAKEVSQATYAASSHA